MKKKPCKLTETDRFTISVALTSAYQRSMENLDMTDGAASFWLRNASDAWDAYKAFVGYSITRYE